MKFSWIFQVPCKTLENLKLSNEKKTMKKVTATGLEPTTTSFVKEHSTV